MSKFSSELNDIESYSYFLQSNQMKNKTRYNNWNFTGDARAWDDDDPKFDSFWYSINTTLLWHTETYKIGREQIDMMDMYLTPEDFTLVGKNITSSFLGIPTSSKDIVYENLIWEGTQDVTEQWMVPKREKYTSSDMIANINFEFTQRRYTRYYYGTNDILKAIGGMRATVLPIINFLIPFIVIYFLVLLSGYIKWSVAKDHARELVDLVKTARKQLILVRNAIQKMNIQLSTSIMTQLKEVDSIEIENIDVDDEDSAEVKAKNMEEKAVSILNLAHSIKREVDMRLEGKEHTDELTHPALIDWILLRYIIEPIFSRVDTLKHLTV